MLTLRRSCAKSLQVSTSVCLLRTIADTAIAYFRHASLKIYETQLLPWNSSDLLVGLDALDYNWDFAKDNLLGASS